MSDNSKAFADLDAFILQLEELPELARDAAPDAAYAVERVIEQQILAGTDPNGTPWAPKKDGSGKPLATAGNALTVVAIGTTIFARLSGYIARHHLGRARGGVARQILPSRELPAAMTSALRRVLAEHFRRRMGGK